MVALAPSSPAPEAAVARRDWLWRWVTTLDHKRIGILYLVTTLVFFLVGSVVDQVVRHVDRPIFLVRPKAVAASPELNVIPRHSHLSEAPRLAKG